MPPTERTTAECFSNTSPAMLLTIANGSQTLKETLNFKTSNGSYVPMQTRFYLGGGLGSDLFVSDSLKYLYIVCLVTIDQQPPSKVSDTTMEEDPLRVLLSEMEHPLGLSCVSIKEDVLQHAMLTHRLIRWLHPIHQHLPTALQEVDCCFIMAMMAI